jgi:tripartite-type tricarboxylate transporter receptor subunit TctC
MCVQITLLTPISAAKQHLLTYYMQRDGIVKSLEQLIPQAQPAQNAHPAYAKGLNNVTKSWGGRRMRRWLGLLMAMSIGIGWNSACEAEDYPARPISMIVPFPAGGATDNVARFLGEKMRAILGQPIVIENVAGAAGSLGVGRAVRSAADGYTLSIGTSTTHVLTGGLYALPFDLFKDLEPVIEIGSEPLLIVGKKSLPADDLKGLITWLKANPDKASVGIAGVGATGHLTGISFQKATGTRFQFVPYRGNSPAMQDLLAEQIDFMIEPASNFLALLGAGSIKPFAITSRTRLSSSPNIPTADEAGLPGFFASLWYGLWVPKGTSKDIIAKLNATMSQILADPKVKQRFAELGIQITPIDQQSPEALRVLQKAEAERWWPIMKASNIKPE